MSGSGTGIQSTTNSWYMGKNGDSFTLYDDHSVWLGELGSDESDDDFHLLNVSSYNDLSSVYFDGQLKGIVSGVNPEQLILSADLDLTSHADMEIAELIIFDRSLSDSERAYINIYLSVKYDLLTQIDSDDDDRYDYEDPHVVTANIAPISQDLATLEEDSTVSIKFSASDSDDGEEDNLIFYIVDLPSNGILQDSSGSTLTAMDDGSYISISGDSITYIPDTDFVGSDSITYVSFDGALYENESGVYSALSVVNVTVNSINESPIFELSPETAKLTFLKMRIRM